MLPTLTALQAALDKGETTSVDLTQAALARIADPQGEGARVFTAVWAEQALAAARASDAL
ncbi:MAG: amidase, partial [Castellaniella sp.]